MNTEQLAARVESLERGMRRWRRLASVLVLGLVVAGTVAATRQERIPDVVTARTFAVVNKAGKFVVVMGAPVNGNGHVSVNNKAGNFVVTMGVDKHSNGRVAVKNKAGELAAAMGADKHSDGRVVVNNKAGELAVDMGASENGGHVAVKNKDGNTVWRSPNK